MASQIQNLEELERTLGLNPRDTTTMALLSPTTPTGSNSANRANFDLESLTSSSDLADSDSISDSDSLNFSTELTRESFQLNNFNDPTSFLLKHYKFWSLDDLLQSLQSLTSDIDTELINLINSNYLNFIKLGNSIDGSFDLIQNLKVDLNGYIKSLETQNEKKINTDLQVVDQLIDYKSKLLNYRRLIQLIISLSTQIEVFVSRCELSKRVEEFDLNRLKELLSLYLNVLSSYRVLVGKFDGVMELNRFEILISLVKKFAYLKLEFKSILNEFLKNHVNELTGVEKFEVMKMISIL
ncbi:unnamed protein product [Ambrosiozyma monospora]|uniref:Conserved oligomeric Golgi complex subunit 2 n=1 Tax=Ambrosiozyma monospora TaxID=43982 RepID=A0A9W6YT04_AMBMO|nr:unnamed protein product [Ambrosiozyma monospora]